MVSESKGESVPGVTQYWNCAAGQWPSRRQALWRRFCDHLHGQVLSDWWPSTPVERVLKTDLFDEVSGAGLCSLLRSRAKTVVGVDLSSEVTVRAAAGDDRLLAASADVRRLPFAGASFDLILSNSTLDHFESRSEIRRGLLEFNRVLRPEGRLLITLDNLTNPLIAIRNAMPFLLLNRLKVVPYFVGASYGWRDLSPALEEVGFQVLEQRAIMHVPRLLAVPIANLTGRAFSEEKQEAIVRLFARFERLQRWPGARYSGHFIAALAAKG
jgi:SAM-dependent methyltransferase